MRRPFFLLISIIFGILFGIFSLLFIIIMILNKVFPHLISGFLSVLFSGIYFVLAKYLIENFSQLSFETRFVLILYYVSFAACLVRFAFVNMCRLFATNLQLNQPLNIFLVKENIQSKR